MRRYTVLTVLLVVLVIALPAVIQNIVVAATRDLAEKIEVNSTASAFHATLPDAEKRMLATIAVTLEEDIGELYDAIWWDKLVGVIASLSRNGEIAKAVIPTGKYVLEESLYLDADTEYVVYPLKVKAGELLVVMDVTGSDEIAWAFLRDGTITQDRQVSLSSGQYYGIVEQRILQITGIQEATMICEIVLMAGQIDKSIGACVAQEKMDKVEQNQTVKAYWLVFGNDPSPNSAADDTVKKKTSVATEGSFYIVSALKLDAAVYAKTLI